MPFRMNNRLDIYDFHQKIWRECFIVDLDNNRIRVHYRGFAVSADEWIDYVREEWRIREVGSSSDAEGWAKYSLKHQQELSTH